ncbi:MAG: hypothetical protein HY040_07585 [Planctomycetes bacterium]|nr:hypothetical protein [Planctomycetota bacterium]
MRAPTAFRHLSGAERDIAKEAFKDTIRYENVLVTNGLGGYDRPFTVPAPGPNWDDLDYWKDVAVRYALGPVGGVVDNLKRLFGSKPPAKFLLNVGDGFAGMAASKNDKAVLIHELTHVWQGEHSGWAWSFVFKSAWHQMIKGDDAYSYALDTLPDGKWGDFNVEQQAEIVEHWYINGKLESDPRFRFIVTEIWDEDWTKYDPVRKYGMVITPVPGGRHDFVPWGDEGPLRWPDSYVLPILQPRYNLILPGSWVGQIQKMEEIFRGIRARSRASDIQDLIRRLEFRRSGDKLSEYFHDNLHHAVRAHLLDILRGKA